MRPAEYLNAKKPGLARLVLLSLVGDDPRTHLEVIDTELALGEEMAIGIEVCAQRCLADPENGGFAQFMTDAKLEFVDLGQGLDCAVDALAALELTQDEYDLINDDSLSEAVTRMCLALGVGAPVLSTKLDEAQRLMLRITRLHRCTLLLANAKAGAHLYAKPELAES